MSIKKTTSIWCWPRFWLQDAQATITAFSIDSKDGSAQNFVADDFVMAMELQEEELDVYTAKTRLPRIRTRDGSTPSAPRQDTSILAPIDKIT